MSYPLWHLSKYVRIVNFHLWKPNTFPLLELRKRRKRVQFVNIPICEMDSGQERMVICHSTFASRGKAFAWINNTGISCFQHWEARFLPSDQLSAVNQQMTVSIYFWMFGWKASDIRLKCCRASSISVSDDGGSGKAKDDGTSPIWPAISIRSLSCLKVWKSYLSQTMKDWPSQLENMDRYWLEPSNWDFERVMQYVVKPVHQVKGYTRNRRALSAFWMEDE